MCPLSLSLKGEIEQLTVSSDPAAVSEQCSPNRVPFYYDSSGGGNDDRRASSNERLSNDIDIEEEGERDFVDNETSGFEGERLNGMIGLSLNARKCCIVRLV